MTRRLALCFCAWASGLAAWDARASDRNVDGILDNSFFIEEAYNQESGVVQHIVNGTIAWNDAGGGTTADALLLFTQEWPLGSQKHQLSYSIPFPFIDTGNGYNSGLGDIFLNYRYQAHFDESSLRAFAPRFSVIFPTGDPDRFLGDDSLGFQTNLPYSQALGDDWFVHANAGATYLRNSGQGAGADLLLYNAGASAIYAVRPTLNFLFETVGLWTESVTAPGRTERDFEAIFSPGARYAINRRNGSQVVLGLAVPVGLTEAAADVGVFLYFSYENRFRP